MGIPDNNQETREMKAHVKLGLYIVAAVSVLWGIALFMDPMAVHGVFSEGPYDPAATGLVGAAMFAYALLFFIAALNPVRPLVNASTVALGFFTVAAVFLMFLSAAMPRNLWTFFSTLLYLSIGLMLFFSTLEPRPAPAIGHYSVSRPSKARRKGAATRRAAAPGSARARSRKKARSGTRKRRR
jgi:hypothetical protein